MWASTSAETVFDINVSSCTIKPEAPDIIKCINSTDAYVFADLIYIYILNICCKMDTYVSVFYFIYFICYACAVVPGITNHKDGGEMT